LEERKIRLTHELVIVLQHIIIVTYCTTLGRASTARVAPCVVMLLDAVATSTRRKRVILYEQLVIRKAARLLNFRE